MSRRPKAGGKARQKRSRKTITPKGARRRASHAVSQETEVARLTRELKEAREQQTATAEVLRVISSSPGELDSVFKEMLEKATHICGASFGTLLLFEGNAFRRVAAHNAPDEYVQFADKDPLIRLDRARSLDRLIKTKEPVQIVDMAEAEPNSP
ncbi:MAG TPA: histidine kinase, partial [Pseudolabrys sp.]|nr:histidine kinase [Pseudolabrys sp.]